jgi:molybdopterin-binding protein
MSKAQLFKPREAAGILGISYPTLKQWIYRGQIKTVKTAGGHHRLAEGELERFLPRSNHKKPEPGAARRNFRRISGRNQLVGRVVDIKVQGFLAQVTLNISGQHITSIVTADAVREMQLKKGEVAAALVKSTEVMIVRV